MTIENQLIEDGIYLVTSKGEADRGYIYNRRNGEHQFSRQMGSIPFMKQIFVKAENGNLEIMGNKVKINSDYLVGAISNSINSAEYERLLEIWRRKRHDSK